MPKVVTVSLEMAEVQRGAWCLDCALPSGVRVSLVLTTGQRMSMHQAARCTECGGARIEER